jgi:hypothetical protein
MFLVGRGSARRDPAASQLQPSRVARWRALGPPRAPHPGTIE